MYIWVCLLGMYNDDYDDYVMLWYDMFYGICEYGVEDSGLVLCMICIHSWQVL